MGGTSLKQKIKEYYVTKDKQGKLNKQTICWQFIMFLNQFQPKFRGFEGTPFIFDFYDSLKKQKDKVTLTEFVNKFNQLLTAQKEVLQKLFFNSVNKSGTKVINQSQFVKFMVSCWESCLYKLVNRLQNRNGQKSQQVPNFNSQKIEKMINLLLLLIEEKKPQVASKAKQQFKLICIGGQLNMANFEKWCQKQKCISVNCSLQGQNYESKVPLQFVQSGQ